MLSEEQKKDAIATIQQWVETIIIGLNLCPFAKTPFQKGAVRFAVADCDNVQAFLNCFAEEIDFLEDHPLIETTLLIIPAFGKVEQFITFMQFCEQTIVLNDWIEKYQIVSFHPYMRFSGIPADSPRNLTGMAPYPILHILRTPSVETLGATLQKDLHTENDKKLSKMTKQEMARLWAEAIRT